MRDGKWSDLPVLILMLVCPVLLSGCASYGHIVNSAVADVDASEKYSINRAVGSERSNQVTLLLAFSGGGARASALAYGVLAALRDQVIEIDGQPRRLLDEVDAISSVSGGSFTAAYYGLHGERMFADFKEDFLYRDVAGDLTQQLFSPPRWFSKRGRTEMAVRYYENHVFGDATFADLQRRDGPLIVINATDLGKGVRFSFVQEYFDLLCSDLSSFPVARAVTASSAVPVIFNPVVLENHDGCQPGPRHFLRRDRLLANDSEQLSLVAEGLGSFAEKQQRRYIHLIDGGITDNLGLLAIYEMVEMHGGAKQFLDALNGDPARRFVVISVDAATEPPYTIESTNRRPSIEETIDAVTDIQLHRANAATLELLHNSVERWSAELSTPDAPVEPYFVEIDFKRLGDPQREAFFNQIPTRLSLQPSQIDSLIEVGRELLQNNGEFQRFIADFVNH